MKQMVRGVWDWDGANGWGRGRSVTLGVLSLISLHFYIRLREEGNKVGQEDMLLLEPDFVLQVEREVKPHCEHYRLECQVETDEEAGEVGQVP